MKSRLPAVALATLLAACGSSDDAGPSAPQSSSSARVCPDSSGVERSTSGDFNASVAQPVRRVVLMGGSTEVDPASRLMVEGAGGGDVLVLRASGSTTSYNAYFRADVGADPAPSSASTIRIDQPSRASSAAVLCWVRNADALWLAGGDQWDYVGHWTTPLHDELNAAASRLVPIGGTSAGAMVLGEAAFDARRGSVGSAEALADPASADVSVSLSPLAQPELAGWIVDTHFRERAREGRLLAFLARMLPLSARDTVYGLGLDERAALVIENGAYRVIAGTGRSAWLYRLVGRAPIVDGQPLQIDGAARLQLVNGASGAWPASFDEADTVRVDAGVVVNGITP
jgi:cyanophycinase